MKKIEVLDPTTNPNIPQREPTERVADLSKVAIGFLDNAKANVDLYLSRVRELMEERYPSAELVPRRKIHAVVPAPEETTGELASSCRVVVNGVGD